MTEHRRGVFRALPRVDTGSMTDFGELLHRYRMERDLTQEDLAEKSGVSVRSISDLERGVKHRPRRVTVRLLVDALALSPQDRAALERAGRHFREAPIGIGGERPGSFDWVSEPMYPLAIDEPLIGREEALSAVLSALPGIDSTAPRLVLVMGDAGLGKTRLLAEVGRRVRERGGTTLAGGCYEQEGRLPYGALHDALLDYFRAEPDQVEHVRAKGLLPELVRILPELGDERFGTGSVQTSGSDEQRLRLFGTITRVFESIIRRRPVVLLLDDLHWSDETTLQLVHFLARQPTLQHMLIVGTYRRDEIPTTGVLAQLLIGGSRTPAVRHVLLTQLDRADIAALLENRLGAPCADDVVGRIHDLSAGNPFFAVEIADLLRQEEHLVNDRTESGSIWRMQGELNLDVPPAVRETVARRLRRLSPEVEEMLHMAAVLGRQFRLSSLQASWDGEEGHLLRALDEAMEGRVIQEMDSTGDAEEYAFRHPLLREVVYRQQSALSRARRHAAAGQGLEAEYGGNASEHAAELAHHFTAAGHREADRARHYLVLAGDAAAHAFAWEEALELFRTALDFTGDETTGAIHERIGSVLRMLGRYGEALESLDDAAERYRAAGDLERMGWVTAAIVEVHGVKKSGTAGRERAMPVIEQLEQTGPSTALAALYLALTALMDESPQEHLREAERASAIARSLGDEPLLARVEVERGLLLFVLGHVAEARAVLEGAASLARAGCDYATLYKGLSILSELLKLDGSFQQCLEYRQLGLAHAESGGGDPLWLIPALAQVGEALFLLGDWPHARVHLERAVALSETLSAPHQAAFALLALGMLEIAEGRCDEASRHIEKCISDARHFGQRHWVQNSERLLAEMDLLAGRPVEARARIEPMLHEERGRSAGTLILLGRAHIDAGDPLSAEPLLLEAVAMTEERSNRLDLIEASLALAVMEGSQGRTAEAADRFEQTLAYAEEMTYPYARGRVLFEFGHMLRQNGTAGADERLMRAMDIFRNLGAQPYIMRIERLRLEYARGDTTTRP